MWIATTIFIDKQQFDLLNFYSFLPTSVAERNICLWNLEDVLNVENGFIQDFESISKPHA